ncbi:substrate-binding periplasmic protein [Pseudomonas boanensis]|uniref:substrate-binding periplasmic protein n=1 Tax=Metapseudomonas boanensis TaxID=2822138 RepID=UPI0035D43DBA
MYLGRRAFGVSFCLLCLIPFACAREWIAVGTDFPGIFQMTPSGEPRGLGVDVLREVARELGDQVRFELYPWARAQKRVEDGLADVLIGPYRTAARERRFQFSEPGFYRDRIAFYARAGTTNAWDGSLGSVRGQRIAIIHGWVYGEHFEAMRGGLDLQMAASVENALKILMAERADLVASNERDTRPRITALGLDGAVIRLEPAIDTQVGYFALPRDSGHNALREAIGGVLRKMREDGRLATMAKPYGIPLP